MGMAHFCDVEFKGKLYTLGNKSLVGRMSREWDDVGRVTIYNNLSAVVLKSGSVLRVSFTPYNTQWLHWALLHFKRNVDEHQ